MKKTKSKKKTDKEIKTQIKKIKEVYLINIHSKFKTKGILFDIVVS